ncbi:protein transport protein SEC31-like [Prionailurus viverrinus]|uniref:protein transport protein SEC31-like n=1 Tax=Prionailurus viverrinus TaxID=61388 RepID=UPI001FF432BE|nr:protein transport protein SEC31-like [Prionailurus viverrinus]
MTYDSWTVVSCSGTQPRRSFATTTAPKIPGNGTTKTSAPGPPPGRALRGWRWPVLPSGPARTATAWTFFRQPGEAWRPGPGAASGSPGSRPRWTRAPGASARPQAGPPPAAPGSQVEVAPPAECRPRSPQLPATPHPPPRRACAPRLLPTGLVRLFRFLSSTLLGSPPPRRQSPPAKPVGRPGGLRRGPCVARPPGPGGRGEAGARRRGAGAGGARAAPAGEGAARGPGPQALVPARALRPSPSVGPKLLKLQKCAGACPPAANKTQPNAARGKSEYGAAENGASASKDVSLSPVASCFVDLAPLVLHRDASFAALRVLPTPPPVFLFLSAASFPPLFLLFFPLSVPLSPFCVTGAFLLSSLSGLAPPPPPARLTLLCVCVCVCVCVSVSGSGAEGRAGEARWWAGLAKKGLLLGPQNLLERLARLPGSCGDLRLLPSPTAPPPDSRDRHRVTSRGPPAQEEAQGGRRTFEGTARFA